MLRLRFRPSHIGGAVVDFGIFYMSKRMFLSFPTRGPIHNFMAIPTQSLNKKALNKNFGSLFHLSVIYKRYLLLKFKCCMKTTPIFDPLLHNLSFNNCLGNRRVFPRVSVQTSRPHFAHRVTPMLLCQCILFGEISLSLLCLVMLCLLARINS